MVMVHTRPAQGEWTVEAWRELPEDGNRYEVIDGVLYVTPAPRLPHQRAVKLLMWELERYLPGSGIGEVLGSPAEIATASNRVVQPDVFVAPLIGGRGPGTWEAITHLVLAVEVLSPGTAARDRGIKRRIYQQHADEYWIVDLDGRVIERWQPGDERPEVLGAELRWQPAGASEALMIDLQAFFRGVFAG